MTEKIPGSTLCPSTPDMMSTLVHLYQKVSTLTDHNLQMIATIIKFSLKDSTSEIVKATVQSLTN